MSKGEKKEVKKKHREVKNFDPEKQQWHYDKIEVRPRKHRTSLIKDETLHQTFLLPLLMEIFAA